MTYKSCNEKCRKEAERPKKYSSPMLCIAIYIAVASLVCPIATAGDVIHGVRKTVLVPETDESCCESYRSEEEEQKKHESPMLRIGIYIAAASLVCSVALAGDLIHGIRQKKLWFPCKFFTVQAASLTVLAVATKLLVDLTTRVQEDVIDTKLISTVFVITIMGNFLTSFSSMDSNAILTNIVAWVFL